MLKSNIFVSEAAGEDEIMFSIPEVTDPFFVTSWALSQQTLS